MNNKEFFHKFESQVFKEIHCDFYDIHFIDGYMVDSGEDSVVDFKIKGLDGWLFGAWIQKDEQGETYLQVFCQYEMFIDKFKPSRGDFNIKVTYRNGEFNIFEVSEALEFMQNHEAIFFCRRDNPYYYIPEWRAKLRMKKCILDEKKYLKTKERIYKLIQYTIKWAYKLKIFQTMYDKDILNEELYHINDVYYIYTTNKLAKIIVKYLKREIEKVFDLGYIWDYDNKAVWMAEYNGMVYDTPPSTKEEIIAECSDIKEKQKTEYKRQYDRLIKYVWED